MKEIKFELYFEFQPIKGTIMHNGKVYYKRMQQYPIKN